MIFLTYFCMCLCLRWKFFAGIWAVYSRSCESCERSVVCLRETSGIWGKYHWKMKPVNPKAICTHRLSPLEYYRIHDD